MADLPEPVVAYLRHALLPGLVYARVDASGGVLEIGGLEDARAGLGAVDVGDDLCAVVDALVGLIPVEGEAITLPMLEGAVPGMARATIHLLAGESGSTWVMIVDGEAVAAMRQPAQQRGNELALLRSQLERQQRLTEARNAELREFAFYVSHDLKAPLRAVRAQSDRLEETGADDAALTGLRRSLDDAESLIRDLLALAGVGESVQWEHLDGRVFIEQLVGDLVVEAGAEVVIEGTWPALETSRTLLTQVVRNLIENGLKYNQTPKRVVVSSETEPGWARIAVADNGIGVEAPYQESIFRPFQRLHSSETYAGTGIGLAIVAKAVRLLGGTVELESTMGVGSRFEVRLPLSRA